jgi:hypothetical protein
VFVTFVIPPKFSPEETDWPVVDEVIVPFSSSRLARFVLSAQGGHRIMREKYRSTAGSTASIEAIAMVGLWRLLLVVFGALLKASQFFNLERKDNSSISSPPSLAVVTKIRSCIREKPLLRVLSNPVAGGSLDNSFLLLGRHTRDLW